LRNIQTELDVQGVTRLVVGVEETVTVEVRRPTSQSMAYVAKPDIEWCWGDLRDYFVHESERRFGSCRRKQPTVEYGIFSGFISRWGSQAPAIARYVFEIQNGLWMGDPVHLENFCRNSDRYFAQPISERLIR
jgi:hypothetical protein